VTRVGFDFLLQISNCDIPTSALPCVIICSSLDRNPRSFIPAMDQQVSEHDGFRLPASVQIHLRSFDLPRCFHGYHITQTSRNFHSFYSCWPNWIGKLEKEGNMAEGRKADMTQLPASWLNCLSCSGSKRNLALDVHKKKMHNSSRTASICWVIPKNWYIYSQYEDNGQYLAVKWMSLSSNNLEALLSNLGPETSHHNISGIRDGTIY